MSLQMLLLGNRRILTKASLHMTYVIVGHLTQVHSLTSKRGLVVVLVILDP